METLQNYMDRTIASRATKKALRDLKPFNASMIRWKSERGFSKDHGMIVQTVRLLAESNAEIDEKGWVFTGKKKRLSFKIRGYEVCE